MQSDSNMTKTIQNTFKFNKATLEKNNEDINMLETQGINATEPEPTFHLNFEPLAFPLYFKSIDNLTLI